MRLLKGIFLATIVVVISTAGGLGWTTRSADPRAWLVSVEVAALNHNLISINDFNWLLLKNGSGDYGKAALKHLKRNGRSDEIRIAADAVLKGYLDDSCGDGLCAVKPSMKTFRPVLRADLMVRDLRPGQEIPHDFVVDTALTLKWCGPQNPDCALRMQDFDGDGRDEIYVETTRRDVSTVVEDEARAVTIYARGDDGWSQARRVMITNFDARNFPQRPFIVTPQPMDTVHINEKVFRFIPVPHYRHSVFGNAPYDLRAQTAAMRRLGSYVDQVPVVFPPGKVVPHGLAAALRSGQISFAVLGDNPPQPNDWQDRDAPPLKDYAQPSMCDSIKDCRAIVADLDHDGHDEVILVHNAKDDNGMLFLDATLLKGDGRSWQVAANSELCRDDVPNIDTAKIEIKPSKWGMIWLGKNRYTIGENPRCDSLFSGLE